MSESPISKLSKREQTELLDGLNYLNTAEIKSFCRQHSIPYAIAIETRDGRRKKTKDDDRKGVMLSRLLHFLQTGVVLEETCIPISVVSSDSLPENLTASDRLFYGQYDKTNRTMIALLRDLTGGHFRSGAIARILARDFWTRGEAPTFGEFAFALLQAVNEHTGPNPEWAYLSDRASGARVSDWKTLRASTASKVLKTLNRISGR